MDDATATFCSNCGCGLKAIIVRGFDVHNHQSSVPDSRINESDRTGFGYAYLMNHRMSHVALYFGRGLCKGCAVTPVYYIVAQ
jgi:hypothetical protein